MELNALLFPAPTIKYSALELEGDIMYIPRYYKFNKQHSKALNKLTKLKDGEKKKKEEKLIDDKDMKNDILKFYNENSQNHIKKMSEQHLVQEENKIEFEPIQSIRLLDSMSEIKEEGPSHKPGSVASVQAHNKKINKGTIKSNDDKEGIIGEKTQEQINYEADKKHVKQEFENRYDPRRISHFIPAMYMPFHMGSSKLLIYFHANAEDIVLSHDLLDYMRVLLRINIVAIEYPGYGLYTENYQKRYQYPKPVNPNLKKDFNTLHNLKKKAAATKQK